MSERYQEGYVNGCRKGRADCEPEIERLREALEPFAEIARRLGWDKLKEDDPKLDLHIIDAPADDIAPGAFYCLMVCAFSEAAAAFAAGQRE